jgi:hypothetical protein
VSRIAELVPLVMSSNLRIGIDFDNTIVTYDEVFCMAAKSLGLLDADFAGNKQSVRDAIRLLPDGELAWQRLQGHVYGKGIADAKLVTGIDTFLRRCQAEAVSVSVVSHKTEFGHFDPDRVNLRAAALNWMAKQGLLDGEYGIGRNNVYFESTRAEKINRIASLSLTHFIDDLEEVLTDPDFPPKITRILYAEGAQPDENALVCCSNWRDIEWQIFGEANT